MTAVGEREDPPGLRWLINVRWGAAATQIVASVSLGLLGGAVPLAPALACVLPVLLSNAWLTRSVGKAAPTERQLFGNLLLDVASLSVWLVLAGGPSNPWSALYLVYVALGALLLVGARPWLVVVAASFGYGATFAIAPAGSDLHAHHGGGGTAFDAHLEGMYVAFVVASVLVAYFVTRVADELRERDRALTEARDRAARIERLAALTTLAAGAAHELGSPLATIAVAAKELERSLGDHPELDALAEDARLVRDEVGRCRSILDRMAMRAGAVTGEAPVDRSLRAIVEALAASLGPERMGLVQTELADASVRLPPSAVDTILENLVRNALDASEKTPVRVSLRIEADELHIVVRDEGAGMDEATLRNALDPFFTTKEPGRGMGLGLFLVDTLTHELGGRLVIDSAPSRGTSAEVVLPRALGGLP